MCLYTNRPSQQGCASYINPDTHPHPTLPYSFAQPRTSDDCLSQLSKELLHHILHFICTESDNAVVNQSLLALRCCNTSLAAASNSARISICLQHSTLSDAASFLSKFTSLAEITIRASPPPAHIHNNTLHLSSSDLRPVSDAVPNLTSLVLNPGSSTQMCLLHMPQMLLPWQHCLQQLTLHCCTLINTSSVVHQPIDVYLLSWSPNLPRLTSLTLTNSQLTSLDLADCQQLQHLELDGNMELSCLGLSGSKLLRKVSSVASWALTEIDLSGCSSLQTLLVTHNVFLVSLLLTGCTALQLIDCRATTRLASLCLTDCSSLTHLTVNLNVALRSLDLSSCAVLEMLSCSCNCFIAVLKLPRICMLQEITCEWSQSLTSLDLSGCGALKVLTVSENSRMVGLDCSALGSLEEVHLCNLKLLTSVNARDCPALQRMTCQENDALLDLDVSGCLSMRELNCSDNHVLESLNLAECCKLENLDRSGCNNLGEVDVSSCHTLARGGSQPPLV